MCVFPIKNSYLVSALIMNLTRERTIQRLETEGKVFLALRSAGNPCVLNIEQTVRETQEVTDKG